MGKYIGIDPYEIEVRYLFELAPLTIIIACRQMIVLESFYFLRKFSPGSG